MIGTEQVNQHREYISIQIENINMPDLARMLIYFLATRQVTETEPLQITIDSCTIHDKKWTNTLNYIYIMVRCSPTVFVVGLSQCKLLWPMPKLTEIS